LRRVSSYNTIGSLAALVWRYEGDDVFAFMQAMGLMNDHAEGCVFRAEALAARGALKLPS